MYVMEVVSRTHLICEANSFSRRGFVQLQFFVSVTFKLWRILIHQLKLVQNFQHSWKWHSICAPWAVDFTTKKTAFVFVVIPEIFHIVTYLDQFLPAGMLWEI